MTIRLLCPFCGQDVWSSDVGAACTDRAYATGETKASLSCGATWDPTGFLDTLPDEDMVMRNFGLSTTEEDEPNARGIVNGSRSDALTAARTMEQRSGEHHFVQPDGARVVDSPGSHRQ